MSNAFYLEGMHQHSAGWQYQLCYLQATSCMYLTLLGKFQELRVPLKHRCFLSGFQPTFHGEEFLHSFSLPQKGRSENCGWQKSEAWHSLQHGYHFQLPGFSWLHLHSCPDHKPDPQHVPAISTPMNVSRGLSPITCQYIWHGFFSHWKTFSCVHSSFMYLHPLIHWLVSCLYITGSFVYSFQSYLCYTNKDALLHQNLKLLLTGKTLHILQKAIYGLRLVYMQLRANLCLL